MKRIFTLLTAMVMGSKKMRKIFGFLMSLAIVIGIAVSAQAVLIDRGGFLIYDTDLNITWYDYTHYSTVEDLHNWANSLSITFGGTTYSDWRLPIHDETYVWGYAGIPTGTLSNSEYNHLFFEELWRTGTPDLLDTGPFQQLIISGQFSPDPYNYFCGDTNGPPCQVWIFSHYDEDGQAVSYSANAYLALAVRDGDVAQVSPVPEPSTMLLLGSGLVGLAGFGRKKFKK